MTDEPTLMYHQDELTPEERMAALEAAARSVRSSHSTWPWSRIVVGQGGYLGRDKDGYLFGYEYARKGVTVTYFGPKLCEVTFTWKQIREACGEPEDGQQRMF